MLLLLRATVLLFMIGSLGGVGLRVSTRDALGPLTNVRFVAVSLVASWIVCPAIAMLVIALLPLARPYEIGLLLVALAPCAPFTPAMVKLAHGDNRYLAAFVVLSAAGTVLMMPIGVPLLIGTSVHPGTIAKPLLLFILTPLMAGMLARDRRPAIAERVAPALEVLTTGAGLVMLILIVILYGRGVVDAIGSYAIAAQLLFLIAATTATYALSTGLPASQRSVVTVGISARNLGAALAPIAAIEPDPRGVVMIAIGALVTILLSAVVARQLGSTRLVERQSEA